MTKILTLRLSTIVLSVTIIGALCLASPPPVSVAAGDPTLDAAIGIIIQATRQEQDRRNAMAATRAAAEAEAIRQRAFAQATESAVSIQQTQVAAEATRNTQSTRVAIEATATRQFLDLQVTVEERRQEAAATQNSILAEYTRQAIFATATSAAISSEATQQVAVVTRQIIERQQQTESTRESLQTTGTILIFVIGLMLAVTVARALWRISPRQPVTVVENEVEQVPPSPDEIPPAPPTRVVYDAEATQRITDILEYQEEAQ
jgi:hypothetical protein